mmetsp:Transcript_42484/g.91689  ORF Transcript_42484/g.91689 Transcript_42484/m.91689 type:complete len:327 (-) Transcript_42484:868-1848(-)
MGGKPPLGTLSGPPNSCLCGRHAGRCFPGLQHWSLPLEGRPLLGLLALRDDFRRLGSALEGTGIGRGHLAVATRCSRSLGCLAGDLFSPGRGASSCRHTPPEGSGDTRHSFGPRQLWGHFEFVCSGSWNLGLRRVGGSQREPKGCVPHLCFDTQFGPSDIGKPSFYCRQKLEGKGKKPRGGECRFCGGGGGCSSSSHSILPECGVVGRCFERWSWRWRSRSRIDARLRPRELIGGWSWHCSEYVIFLGDCPPKPNAKHDSDEVSNNYHSYSYSIRSHPSLCGGRLLLLSIGGGGGTSGSTGTGTSGGLEGELLRPDVRYRRCGKSR